MNEAVNLCLFILFLAKVGVLCGFALSIPVLLFCDRVRAIGIEQVRGEQLASVENRSDTSVFDWATSSPRKKVA